MNKGKSEFYFKDSKAYTEDDVLIYNVFVYKVPVVLPEDLAKAYFERFGKVKQVTFYRGNRQRFSRYKVGFINFADPCAAANALKTSRHFFNNFNIFVKPCYSWTQPRTEDATSAAESQLMEPPYIFNLNDDCLLHIFNMLEFRARLNLARSCERFKALFLQYSQLKDFDMSNLCYVTIFEAHEFFKMAGNKILKISGLIPGNGVDRYIDMIGRFCTNAESITFSDIRISSAIFRKWTSKWPKLTKLQLISCTINDSCLKAIKQITNLNSLTVTDCSDITGRHIDDLPKLTELCLTGCVNVTLSNLTCILKKLKNLTKLDIRHCERLSFQSNVDFMISKHAKLSEVQLSVINLPCILETPQLKHLEIQNRTSILSMPSSLFDAMSKRENLMMEHLSLSVTDAVNLERTKAIVNLKNLKFLRIYGSQQLNDDCIHLLAINLQQLEVFELDKCRSVTEYGLIELVKECKNLKTLGIKGSKTINEKFILNVIEVLKSRTPKKSAPLHIEVSRSPQMSSVLQNATYQKSASLVNLKIETSFSAFGYELDSDYSVSDVDLYSDDDLDDDDADDDEDNFNMWHAIINNFAFDYSDDDEDDYLYYDHDLLDDFEHVYNRIH